MLIGSCFQSFEKGYTKSVKLYIHLEKRKEQERISTAAVGCAQEKLL